MLNMVFEEVKHKMDVTKQRLAREFGGVRTGRASLGLLDGISIDYYGVQTPLNQVASLSTPDPLTINVQPWDAGVMPVIEKAILSSDLGLTPSTDGKMIRIPIPPLTEERRKELTRLVRKMAEDAKIALRNVRREGVDHLKKLEKEKQISEDDAKKGQDRVQKITDENVTAVDKLTAAKETEIMDR